MCRKYVKCDRVSYIYVPQYKALSIEHILQRLKKHPQVFDYLPEEQDWGRLPRQFICNIANTIIGKPFAQWVMQADDDRNQGVAAKQDCMIHMDPEIAKVFAASTAVSSKPHTLSTQSQPQGVSNRTN